MTFVFAYKNGRGTQFYEGDIFVILEIDNEAEFVYVLFKNTIYYIITDVFKYGVAVEQV